MMTEIATGRKRQQYYQQKKPQPVKLTESKKDDQ